MSKIIIITFLFLVACNQKQSCDDIPERFNSFSELEKTIKNTDFIFTDDVNTYKSSWIRGANYYSCNRKDGFLIISTDTQNYIYSDLPIDIWFEFKDAESYGRFYTENIRNKYKVILNKYINNNKNEK